METIGSKRSYALTWCMPNNDDDDDINVHLINNNKVIVIDRWNGGWFVKVEDQMKLLENCWSELLLLDVLYKQLEHSDTQQLLMVLHISYHITLYHIVDLTWQNHLKIGADKPKLKVKMQSVSDDVWKRLLEKLHFEVAAEGVFRLGRCYILRQGVPAMGKNGFHFMPVLAVMFYSTAA